VFELGVLASEVVWRNLIAVEVQHECALYDRFEALAEQMANLYDG
jgi:hypothetical protein